MEIAKELKTIFIETAEKLNGWDRCIFMAKVVQFLGKGGQRRAEKEFGWNRGTIRRGMKGMANLCIHTKRIERRGRKRVEEQLPNLLEDIKEIVEAYSQIDQYCPNTE
jgi:hypothetical protein